MIAKTRAGKEYGCLIFDADHTLVDYDADERKAFYKLLSEYGVTADEAMLTKCREISERTWSEAGLYDVHSARIQRVYHELYRSHLRLAFARVFALFPTLSENAEPVGAAERFLRLLEEEGTFSEGCEKTLKALSSRTGGKYRICVATNGLHDIQTGRLKGLGKYFHKLYISEDVGAIKPLPAFFSRLLDDFGARAEECLMIGDSLFSDVAGANGAGMDSCWLNADGRENGTEIRPTYEIRSLGELTALLL